MQDKLHGEEQKKSETGRLRRVLKAGPFFDVRITEIEYNERKEGGRG